MLEILVPIFTFHDNGVESGRKTAIFGHCVGHGNIKMVHNNTKFVVGDAHFALQLFVS